MIYIGLLYTGMLINSTLCQSEPSAEPSAQPSGEPSDKPIREPSTAPSSNLTTVNTTWSWIARDVDPSSTTMDQQFSSVACSYDGNKLVTGAQS